MRPHCLFFLLFVVPACASTTELSAGGARVEVAVAPRSDCQFLGTARAEQGSSGDSPSANAESARATLRNQAAVHGGTLVVFGPQQAGSCADCVSMVAGVYRCSAGGQPTAQQGGYPGYGAYPYPYPYPGYGYPGYGPYPYYPGYAPQGAPAPQPSASAAPELPEFSREIAMGAITTAAGMAAECKSPNGASGKIKVKVTFAPTGEVSAADLEAGQFTNTPVVECVQKAFRRARVPAFRGDPVTVSKSITIQG